MNGSSVLLDTNAGLYLLNGNKALAELLKGKRVYLSFITEIELQGFPFIKEE